MRVDDVTGTDAHVADLLALYHLDALDRRSAEQVGRHLKSCRPCRAAAVEVCETLAALALLGDDKDHLLNLYGALGTAVPPAFPARFAPQEPAEPPRRDPRESDRRRFRLGRGGTGPAAATREAPAAAASDAGRREPPPQRVAPSPAPPSPAPPPVTPSPATPPPVAPPRLVPPPAPSPPAAPPTATSPPVTPSLAAPSPAVPPPAALAHETPPLAQRAAPQVVPGPQPAARPTAHPARSSQRPTTAGLPDPDLDRSPDSRLRDGSRRSDSTPRRLLPRRAAAFAGLSILLAGTLTVAGISAKALLTPSAPEVQTATVRTAVASATDQDSGANLSVFVTQEDNRVTVRATLSGLDKGAGYRLYGYTFDGRQRPLVNWTGRDGVQELDGELPVGIADLSHFAVTRGTRVVVTAYLPRDAGAAPTTGR